MITGIVPALRSLLYERDVQPNSPPRAVRRSGRIAITQRLQGIGLTVSAEHLCCGEVMGDTYA